MASLASRFDFWTAISILAVIFIILPFTIVIGGSRGKIPSDRPTSDKAQSIAAVSTCVTMLDSSTFRMKLADGSIVVVECYKYPLQMHKVK